MLKDANHSAEELREENQSRYLTFALANDEYGIEIGNVTEIIGVQPITRLPEAPDYVKGIINLRGKIIPVIDMRLRFKKEETAYNDRTCIIVIEMLELLAGLIVDNVTEVLTIAENEILETPRQGGIAAQNQYIRGIGKVAGTVMLLLDCEKLLQEDACPDSAEMI